MMKFHQQIDELITKLQSYSDDIISCQGKILEEDILDTEKKLGITLPSDFRYFLSRMNGFSLYGDILIPIVDSTENFIQPDIIEVNKREHTEVENEMPDFFLPFAANGRGDHYCFDLRKKNLDGTSPVIFWQWDYSFFHPDDIDQTHNNFIGWVEELIEAVDEELEV